MDIRAKAALQPYLIHLAGCIYFKGAESCDCGLEAALTATHDAGDKAGYERGWNEGVEAAAITVEPSIHLGKEQVARVREKIRRLRKVKGE